MGVRDTLREQSKAKTFESGTPINFGANYVLKVVKVKGQEGRTRAGGKTTYFIAEHKVIKADVFLTPDEIEKLAPQFRPNKVGTTASLVVDLNTDWGGGIMLNYLKAVSNDPIEAFQENDGAYIEELCDDVRNPCKGLYVGCTTSQKPVKGKEDSTDPKDLRTRQKFTHMGDVDKENAAWLDEIDKKIAAAKAEKEAAAKSA
jgi:hypothetical protein